MNPHDLEYFHPAWQVLSTLLGFYVAWLGIKRMRSLHFGQQTAFPRSRHITLGIISLAALILGAIGGSIMVHSMSGHWFVGGPHAWLGSVIVLLALVGLITGLVLRRPKARKALPLFHGLVNFTLLALCLINFYLGDEWLDSMTH